MQRCLTFSFLGIMWTGQAMGYPIPDNASQSPLSGNIICTARIISLCRMLFVPHGRCRLCGFLCFPPLRTVHATFIAHGAPSVTYHRLEAIVPALITSAIITSTSTFLHRFNCLLFFVSLHLLMLDTFPRSSNPIRHIYL